MKKTRVYVKDATDLKAAVADVFRDIGVSGLEGKTVLVKPNMLRAAQPGDNINTHPLLLSETVAFLVGHGADVIVGDNSAPPSASTELEIAKICGFIDASHGCFRNISRFTKKVKLKNLLEEVYVSREVFDCDLMVSLPKLKWHDLTTLSVAIKNQFGIIPGGLKPHIHSLFPRIDDFSKALLEIYDIRPPDIIIVDCLDITDARGKRFRPNKIIAGTNGHAIDYICAKIAGISPSLIPTLRIALEQGILDPELVECIGTLEQLHGYGAPLRFPFRTAVVEFVARFLYRIWLGRKPYIDPSVCTRCLSCENVCPTQVIKNQHIDYARCIKCYCCVEVCPNRAVKTKYRLFS